MRITILGAGRVGGTLRGRFADAGHDVLFGVRAPDDPKHTGRHVAAVPEAVQGADLVVLATPWAAAEATLKAAGTLDGQVLIDATNPIGPGMVLTHGTTDSGAEQVARWVPKARVVKAFNTCGVEVMANPAFGAQRSVLWICGDDDTACTTVSALALAIGFEPVRLGGLSRARVTEPAALAWILAAGPLGTREFAYGVLRR
jgi:8-hydroxy-5-deazaflavin:NADPH oxidoreductase